MKNRMLRQLLSVAVVLIFAFSLMPSQVLSQVSRNQPQSLQYQGVGLIRQVITEFGDPSTSTESEFESATETFWFQERVQGNLGRMFQLSGNQDFARLIDHEVRLRGSINYASGQIVASAVSPLGKIPAPRQVHPERFPMGQTTYDLDTKQGQTDFEMLLTEEAMVLPEPTIGPRQIVYVPFTFTDSPPTLSSEQIEQRVHSGTNSVRGFFSEASFNRFNVESVVLPTIALNRTDDQYVGCTVNVIFGSLVQELLTMIPQGLMDSSNNFVFLPPVIPGCSVQATATVGNRGQNINDQYAFIQLGSLFMNDPYKFIGVVVHELGHEFGLQHAEGVSASGIVCGSCDISDFMSSRLRYPNAYHRWVLGWFVGKATVLNGVGSYSVTLKSPAVIQDKRPSRIVIIPRYNLDGSPTGEMKFVEVRANQNFYELFASPFTEFLTGLSIRKGSMNLSLQGSQPYLIHPFDANPFSYHDAPILPGEQFVDDSDGISIIHNSYSIQGGARATIVLARGP